MHFQTFGHHDVKQDKHDDNDIGSGFLYIASPQQGDLRLFLRPSVRPGRQWRGSNPRQKGPCRSQGGLTSHCATDTPRTLRSSIGLVYN
ncbi:hypothetical protein PoB_000312600 [Plakobranchus ocellatus]|uniref:Uncharacterized protein n=1 Tax=Plakobranchus ocellatus TaxID=259542 RepID=A0AAV3Y0K6_9GAST|nr:hypothetical protein PoB_000312600 [Plakobranchus ocellatus]